MLRISLIAICLPMAAFAAGTEDTTTPPPPPACEDGMVRDAETGTCTAPQDARLDDAERYDALRAYANAGNYGAATRVLDAMQDQTADGVLTYRGFTARKQGNTEQAMQYYRAALRANPDNLLARSYMGQGLVEAGLVQEARAQLTEIRARGGRGTWAEVSLRLALQSGQGFSY